VLGICKDQKQVELMKDMGLGNYMLDFKEISEKQLISMFELLERNRWQISNGLEYQNNLYAQALERQYSSILDNI
jgi:hypothetical protein